MSEMTEEQAQGVLKQLKEMNENGASAIDVRKLIFQACRKLVGRGNEKATTSILTNLSPSEAVDLFAELMADQGYEAGIDLDSPAEDKESKKSKKSKKGEKGEKSKKSDAAPADDAEKKPEKKTTKKRKKASKKQSSDPPETASAVDVGAIVTAVSKALSEPFVALNDKIDKQQELLDKQQELLDDVVKTLEAISQEVAKVGEADVSEVAAKFDTFRERLSEALGDFAMVIMGD